MKKKIVLLSGPRQVGKTTLSKSLSPESHFQYLNWDATEDRALILTKKWDRSKKTIILDELHKMKKFKSYLKGIYDKEGVSPSLVVTGSARLDIAKKMGDSLAGRFFQFRLHPLDLWELRGTDTPLNIYNRLRTCSGFPEPYLEGSLIHYARWSKTHLDIILRQDLLDLEAVRDISSIETLISLLQHQVGSNISSASLARDLQKDPKTIRSWLNLLENLFVIFKVTPYSKNISRSLLKEPKYYFYDLARVQGDEGQVLENMVAIALKKQLDYLGDVHGKFGEVYYLRTREKKEIDFFITFENKKLLPVAIEVKLSDDKLSENFQKFKLYIPQMKCLQLVKNLAEEKIYPSGEKIFPALDWLSNMDFNNQIQ